MRHTKFSALMLVTTGMLGYATLAQAELQLSAYGGANWNFDSRVKTEKGTVSDSRNVSWKGKPFEAPPYWGLRAGYWFEQAPGWGVALDYTHQKAYGDINFATDPVFDHLEFTDGNNIITLNAMYRFKPENIPLSLYVGGGPGIAIPHSEVTLDAFPGQRTSEYQLTGFAAQVLAGAEYRFANHWGAFGEGKLTYTNNNTDLSGGGSLKTDIVSPQLLAGISYHFD